MAAPSRRLTDDQHPVVLKYLPMAHKIGGRLARKAGVEVEEVVADTIVGLIQAVGCHYENRPDAEPATTYLMNWMRELARQSVSRAIRFPETNSWASERKHGRPVDHDARIDAREFQARFHILTDRERRVLTFIGDGLGCVEIAAILGIHKADVGRARRTAAVKLQADAKRRARDLRTTPATDSFL